MGYLRGKSNAEVEELKRSLAARDIEFVSRYSFWAIFRSEHDFELYTPAEELAIIEKIRRPMLPGSVLSWLAFAASLFAVEASLWALPVSVLLAVYAFMCTVLGCSYTRLLRRLRREAS